VSWAPARLGATKIEPRSDGSTKILEENEGLLRVYLSARSRRILGAQMAAPRAEHLAHLLALAVHQRMTAKSLLEMRSTTPCWKRERGPL